MLIPNIRIAPSVQERYLQYGDNILRRNVKLFHSTETKVDLGNGLTQYLYEPGLLRKLINKLVGYNSKNNCITCNEQPSLFAEWLARRKGDYSKVVRYEAVPKDMI